MNRHICPYAVTFFLLFSDDCHWRYSIENRLTSVSFVPFFLENGIAKFIKEFRNSSPTEKRGKSIDLYNPHQNI